MKGKLFIIFIEIILVLSLKSSFDLLDNITFVKFRTLISLIPAIYGIYTFYIYLYYYIIAFYPSYIHMFLYQFIIKIKKILTFIHISLTSVNILLCFWSTWCLVNLMFISIFLIIFNLSWDNSIRLLLSPAGVDSKDKFSTKMRYCLEHF